MSKAYELKYIDKSNAMTLIPLYLRLLCSMKLKLRVLKNPGEKIACAKFGPQSLHEEYDA